MAFKNFKLETDSDGIVLVTWDTPGRSMNVLDETSVVELEAIVKQTTEDAAIKGVVITSAKEAFCAGADLTMLEGMNHTYQRLLKEKGEVAANRCYATLDELAERALAALDALAPEARLRRAGLRSPKFDWLPT